jgi:hypothetical protein
MNNPISAVYRTRYSQTLFPSPDNLQEALAQVVYQWQISRVKETHSSQRGEGRYRVAAYADITSAEHVLLMHRLKDLSLHGAAYEFHRNLEVGSTVDVSLSFPRTGEHVHVKGDVVWCTGLETGLHWHEMTTSLSDKLDQCIASSKTGDAGRSALGNDASQKSRAFLAQSL